MVDVSLRTAASVREAGEATTVPARVMTNTGVQAAVCSASVRTELSAIRSREHASVLRGSSDATARTPVQRAPSGRAVCRGASVGREDPAIKQPENVCAETDSLGLSVRQHVPGNARYDAPARMVASAGAKGSVLAPPGGQEQFAQSDAQRDDMDPTVLRSVSATTEANVTLKLDSASVLKGSQDTGAMRSALQAPTVRTVKACVTVRTVRAATTSMEAACASRASAAHTAGIGCVHPANTACTVSAPASARKNTLSAVTQ